jgi:hypothetical protein
MNALHGSFAQKRCLEVLHGSVARKRCTEALHESVRSVAWKLSPEKCLEECTEALHGGFLKCCMAARLVSILATKI